MKDIDVELFDDQNKESIKTKPTHKTMAISTRVTFANRIATRNDFWIHFRHTRMTCVVSISCYSMYSLQGAGRVWKLKFLPNVIASKIKDGPRKSLSWTNIKPTRIPVKIAEMFSSCFKLAWTCVVGQIFLDSCFPLTASKNFVVRTVWKEQNVWNFSETNITK